MKTKRYVIIRSDMAIEDERPMLKNTTHEEDDFMAAVVKYNEWCEWGGSILLIDTENNQILKQCIHHVANTGEEQHFVSVS